MIIARCGVRLIVDIIVDRTFNRTAWPIYVESL